MDSRLIRKFFNGECTTEEAAEFLRWLKSNRSDRELSEFLDEKWEELDHEFSSKSNLLEKIHQAIDDRKKDRKSLVNPWLKIAASVAFLLAAFWLAIEFTGALKEDATHLAESQRVIAKSTEKGQKLRVALPDGSTAMLNSATEISFPESFSDTMRVVELSGEAFFEVERDERRPFIVKTSDVATRVLGTSFNVRYRPGEKEIQVALLSGSVNIDTKTGGIMLEPGDMAVFDTEDDTLVKEKWDYKKDFGWKDGILYFNRATLTEIKEKLEMWYGVEIKIENQARQPRHFTGSFKNENLENILESLSFTFGFAYNMDEKIVSVKF